MSSHETDEQDGNAVGRKRPSQKLSGSAASARVVPRPIHIMPPKRDLFGRAELGQLETLGQLQLWLEPEVFWESFFSATLQVSKHKTSFDASLEAAYEYQATGWAYGRTKWALTSYDVN